MPGSVFSLSIQAYVLFEDKRGENFFKMVSFRFSLSMFSYMGNKIPSFFYGIDNQAWYPQPVLQVQQSSSSSSGKPNL